tara:strand:- start:708 stop:1058 length:351 start_codon:yes stop_codon:yes gene_type:complete
MVNELLQHGLLSLAGLLIYSLILIKDNLRKFNFRIFLNDNKPFWIWAFILQLIFAGLITFFPESGDAIKTLSGVDLSQPMAFLTSGAVLGGVANWATGKSSPNGQIGKKSSFDTSV